MAALNFPLNPSNGDVYGNYTYVSSSQTWELSESLVGLSSVGDVDLSTSPTNRLSLAYSSSTKTWKPTASQILPIGVIIPHAGLEIPSGFLACDGSTFLRTAYPELFAVIGTTYNTGNESSTVFRLPNLLGRTAVGHDDGAAWADFRPIGKTAGEKTHALTVDNLPSHTHTQDAHNHTQDYHSHTQDAHSHGATAPFNAGTWEIGSIGYPGSGSFRDRVGVTGGWGLGTDGRQPYIYGRVATNQNTTAENQYAGSSSPHNNLQPYMVVNYIIKY
jgi:microcystin-dependent protein